ncbi:unnamed protein product, partial [Didymodactylos carnosus]
MQMSDVVVNVKDNRKGPLCLFPIVQRTVNNHPNFSSADLGKVQTAHSTYSQTDDIQELKPTVIIIEEPDDKPITVNVDTQTRRPLSLTLSSSSTSESTILHIFKMPVYTVQDSRRYSSPYVLSPSPETVMISRRRSPPSSTIRIVEIPYDERSPSPTRI